MNIGEQARTLLRELEGAHMRFIGEAVQWPPIPTIEVLLATLNSSVRRSQEFFSHVREEELRKARAQEESQENKDNGVVETLTEPIVNLL